MEYMMVNDDITIYYDIILHVKWNIILSQLCLYI